MSELESLAYDLRIACQHVSRRVRFESDHDLAPHLVSVLGRLSRGSATPGELAEAERVSAPSMTRTTNCLVERGLVDRVSHPSDGRSKVLQLTPAGREALDRVARARDDWMTQRVRLLAAEEREVLRRAISILNREVLA